METEGTSAGTWYKNPIDHIRDRPETYVGAVEPVDIVKKVPVLVDSSIEIKEINVTVSPVLLKIVDEVLVNAVDNQHRGSSQKMIDFSIIDGYIQISNDGHPISTNLFEDSGIRIPEVYFGRGLSGQNFNDNEQRFTGGRNGIGAKATFVFSEDAEVEIFNAEEGIHYTQRFYNNLKDISEPKLKSYKKKTNQVIVKFKPDFEKLQMPNGMTTEIQYLLMSRAFEACACTRGNISVSINGNKNKIPIKNLSDYVKYFSEGAQVVRDEKKDSNFEVVVGYSKTSSISAFVNGIKTNKGKHVDFVIRTIISCIQDKIRKKLKKQDFNVTPTMIKDRIYLAMNILVVNPKFEGQLKECLDTPYKIDWNPSAAFKSGLERMFIDSICEADVNIQNKQIQKETKSVKHVKVEKYQAATKLGKKGAECTLLVTEGDSAKALAIAGLSAIGREYFGVIPLRGKIINVLKNKPEKVHENKEIIALTQILGLKYNHTYTQSDIDNLPYKHVCIFSDQDADGSHIAGLFINWIHAYYKSLLELHPSFIKRFATPLIKVWTSGKSHPFSFFSYVEYNNWLSENTDIKIVKTKYYKGLGTSDDKEAEEYFQDLNKHEIELLLGPTCSPVISTFFDPTKANERKDFLSEIYNPNTYVDYTQSSTSIGDYIINEMSHFSNEDNIRSIPSIVDSLKPVQRKIIFSLFNGANSNNEVKVATLGAQVIHLTAYHHGDESVKEAIVHMAQRYVGKNNIALLVPKGQFGTRAKKGNHAAHRYINTLLANITRTIFHKDDDHILDYLTDEGKKIEPFYYMPVIPLILVNGADGIGTGWSTTIPNYNVKDILHNLRTIIKKKRGDCMDVDELKTLIPYYQGFRGNIELNEDSFLVSGKIQVNRNPDDSVASILITELPINCYIEDFEKLIYDKLWHTEKDGFVSSFEDDSTNSTINITLKCPKETNLTDEYITKSLHIERKCSLKNMVLHDRNGRLKKYATPNDIIEEFIDIRLEYYEKRREWKLNKLKDELLVKEQQHMFIQCVIDKKIDITQTIETLEQEMETLQFVKRDDSYSYLLRMHIQSMTATKVKELQKEIEKIQNDIQIVESQTIYDMWEYDLNTFEEEYDKYINSLNVGIEKKRKLQPIKLLGKKPKK